MITQWLRRKTFFSMMDEMLIVSAAWKLLMSAKILTDQATVARPSCDTNSKLDYNKLYH